MTGLADALTLVAAAGSGLMAGTFFGFSTFVMQALRGLPPAHGIAAMQKINVVVINRVFLGVFVGTAVACVTIVALTFLTAVEGWAWRHAGAGLYTVGCVGVTAAFNVPRNDALARLDPAGSAAASYWPVYVREWTAWNTVRTVMALAASLALVVGLAAS